MNLRAVRSALKCMWQEQEEVTNGHFRSCGLSSPRHSRETNQDKPNHGLSRVTHTPKVISLKNLTQVLASCCTKSWPHAQKLQARNGANMLASAKSCPAGCECQHLKGQRGARAGQWQRLRLGEVVQDCVRQPGPQEWRPNPTPSATIDEIEATHPSPNEAIQALPSRREGNPQQCLQVKLVNSERETMGMLPASGFNNWLQTKAKQG